MTDGDRASNVRERDRDEADQAGVRDGDRASNVRERDRAEADPARVRERGWFEIRWRQFRRAPAPVVRAVVSSVAVAAVLGILFLVYDLALDAGAGLPGGDLRVLVGFLFVAAVAVLGAWLTYLVVPQPGRPGVRSKWSAALGLFAALPIAYLALVILFQIVKPLLTGRGG